MKRSAVLSRVFFRRQEVRSLLPDLKLLLAVIFVSCESHVGCWIPGDLAKDSGLDEESLSGGLDVLEKHSKLIMRDRRTGELFILWWFRDNTFKGAQRGAQALADFKMVESQVLREAILDAVSRNPECGLSADFLGGINKNQMVINQGEVEVEVKKPPPPNPPQGGSAPQRAGGGGLLDLSNLNHVQQLVADGLDLEPALSVANGQQVIDQLEFELRQEAAGIRKKIRSPQGLLEKLAISPRDLTGSANIRRERSEVAMAAEKAIATASEVERKNQQVRLVDKFLGQLDEGERIELEKSFRSTLSSSECRNMSSSMFENHFKVWLRKSGIWLQQQEKPQMS